MSPALSFVITLIVRLQNGQKTSPDLEQIWDVADLPNVRDRFSDLLANTRNRYGAAVKAGEVIEGKPFWKFRCEEAEDIPAP